MAQFDMRSPSAFPTTAEIPAERVTAFLRKVYGWMFVGLAVTAVVASTVAGSPTLIQHVFSNQFLFMGLIGLILASIVGMFWHNDALQFLITVIGVIVFTGLTAWDAQRLKQMAATVPEERMGSYAVVGALALYLNFINLFLMLLRVLGGRRD